jgi:chloramphenicol-sensitive protein RarD
MLIFFRGSGRAGLRVRSLSDAVLLILSGIVTALPMILYNMVVNEIPFKTVGILAVRRNHDHLLLRAPVFMHESVTPDKLIMFVFIWAGLIIYTIGSFRSHGELQRE